MKNKAAESILICILSVTAGLVTRNVYSQTAPPGTPAYPDQGWCPGCGPMMGWGYMGWWGFAMMILFWILVIAGIVFLVRWVTQRGSGGPGEETALDILKKRYARGEIGKEEYEEKKRDLA